MKRKTFSKLIALALTLIMSMSVFTAFAATIYSPGPTEYELDRSGLLSSTNASVSGEDLVLKANSSMTFDLLLPFDSDNLVLTCNSYAYSAREVVINIDGKELRKTVSREVTEITVPVGLPRGSHTLTISCARAITFTGVNFKKVNENYTDHNPNDIPLNDYEEAVLTSVIMKEGATVVKTRGSLQRYDYEDIRLAPMNIDGRLYVPFAKTAEALGYYSEELPDKGFLYMAGEKDSLSLIGGVGVYEADGKGRTDVEIDILYREGHTWVPIRALAETLGFTVEYRDGFVVIDDRLVAKNIVEDETVFAALEDEFEEYIPDEKKAAGRTYHVAQTSNAKDTNAGTEAYPFRTLNKAAKVAKAGDTVIIHEGTYRETLKPANSGTVFAPITFKAAEGEDVLISALNPVSGFMSYDVNIRFTTVDNDLGFGRNQLFYKGEALVEGRHPNTDTKPGVVPYPADVPAQYPTRGNIAIKSWADYGQTLPADAKYAYSDTDLNQKYNNFWQGGTFVTLKGEGWSMVSGDIVSSEPGRIEVKSHDAVRSYSLGDKVYIGGTHPYYRFAYGSDYGYITNHLHTVDKAGEWYMKDGELYVYPPAGANLDTDFEIKQRQLVIDLRDRQYITIKGINTIGGGMTTADTSADGESKGIVINGGTHKYIAHHTRLLDQSRYTLDENTSVQSSAMTTLKAGEAGFYLDGEMNAVINTKIDFSSATGVTAVGKYHYISNNVITNTSYSGGYPGSIWLTIDTSSASKATALSGGHFVTHNTLINAGRATLTQGSSYGATAQTITPNEIAYNRFAQGSLCSRDTGTTYEYGFAGGNDKSKTRMHHNFAYNPGYKDADTGYLTQLIFHDGWVTARDTYNNVTYYQEQDKAPGKEMGTSDATVTVIRARNNAALGYLPNGEADIDAQDFPGERPFDPGSSLDGRERYLTNYENFVNGVKPNTPKDVPSVVNGTEVYTFENVYIPGGQYSLIETDLTREYSTSSSTLVPQNFTITAKVYNSNGQLVQTQSLLNSIDGSRFYIHEVQQGIVALEPLTAGTYKIELTMSDIYSDVYRLRVKEAPAEYQNIFADNVIMGGSWDSYIQPNTSKRGVPGRLVNITPSRLENYTFNCATSYQNHVLIYNDREITQAMNTVKLTLGTDASHGNSMVELYINSTDSTPIATYDVVDAPEAWGRITAEIPLTSTLQPGTYDFYVKFVDTVADRTGTGDFHGLIFYNK